jgi:uncharacterized membrane protein
VGTAYTATLVVKSDDPMHPKVMVPVTMNVVEPVYGMEVSADQEGDCPPGLAITYTVMVTNTSNFSTDSFTVTVYSAGYTTTVTTEMLGPLDMGESATFQVVVHVPAEAQEGDHDTAQVMVTSVGDPAEMAMVNITTNVIVIPPPMYIIYMPVISRIP